MKMKCNTTKSYTIKSKNKKILGIIFFTLILTLYKL
jgi:hypothetical protein